MINKNINLFWKKYSNIYIQFINGKENNTVFGDACYLFLS